MFHFLARKFKLVLWKVIFFVQIEFLAKKIVICTDLIENDNFLGSKSPIFDENNLLCTRYHHK